MRGSTNICAHLSGQEDSEQGVMAGRSGLQAQISSVIEILANSAVVEICRLVEDGYAALCSQMDQERQQRQKENDVLRQKLREMDQKLRGCERKLRRRRRQEKVVAVRLDPVQEGQNPGEETPPTDTVFDTGATSLASSSPQSPPSPTATDVMMDLTSRPRVKGSLLKPLWKSLRVNNRIVQDTQITCKDFPENHTDCLVKPKVQPDETTDDELNPSHLSVPVEVDEPSPDHLNILSLDLAWRQEQTSHLDAAYAVAQLGLASTNTEHPLSCLLAQGEGDSPPTMLFTSGANKKAAFSPSFDSNPVYAAFIGSPPSHLPAVSTASSAGTHSQMPSFRSSVSFAKKPVVCAVCNQVFSGSAALKLHQQAHTEGRPYTCCHCGKGFTQPNNLRVHLLVHTGERRYCCTLCGKGFTSSSHLKRHRTVHTQEKPYSCSRCGQSFSQRCSVRRHRQQSQCGL